MNHPIDGNAIAADAYYDQREQVASLRESLTELADLIREDQELNTIADKRSSGPFVRVSLDELRRA